MHEIDNTKIAQVHNCNIDELPELIRCGASDLTIASQNIRSIYTNFNDLLLNLANLHTKLDMIILSECRLNPNKEIPILNDYDSFKTTNHQNKADGVVAYIRNTHKFKAREIKLIHASCL